MKNTISLKLWALIVMTLLASNGWGFETNQDSKITGDLEVTGDLKRPLDYVSGTFNSENYLELADIRLYRISTGCYAGHFPSAPTSVTIYALSERGKILLSGTNNTYYQVTNPNSDAGSIDIIEFIIEDGSNIKSLTAGCGVGVEYNDNHLYFIER